MQANQTTVQKMLGGTKVFLLPLFQRRYKWAAKDWNELWDDLLSQYDDPDVIAGDLEENEGHFLGSIVIHPAPGPASTVARYLLIDGQQRLTTLLVLIAAFRDFRKQRQPAWDVNAYNHQYLTNPYNPEHPNRLVPTGKDRESYISTVNLSEPTGQIGRTYRFFLKKISDLDNRDGEIDFVRFENSLLLRMLVVDVTTSTNDNVNHIFHTLNHAGQKLAPLDLIRNHAFMQIESDDLEEAYENTWLPMETKLGERKLQRYLWAQLVRRNPKATQQNLFQAYEQDLTGKLRQVPASQRSGVVRADLDVLALETSLFEAIEATDVAMHDDDAQLLPPSIWGRLESLHRWGSSTHTPLTLEVLSRFLRGSASEYSTSRALASVLSFMVRRALCSIPTNNLNRIFTSLPSVLEDETPIDLQVVSLLSQGQRYWPSDADVRQRAQLSPVYLTSRPYQVRFILAELEKASSAKEFADTDALQVEHILPQTLTDEWRKYLTDNGDSPDQTMARLHTLGNLTLTGYNPELGNSSFLYKREIFQNSPLMLNKYLAERSAWTMASISDRTEMLVERSLAIWQGPESQSGSGPESAIISLAETLTVVPEECWTTVEQLAEMLARSVDDVREEIAGIDPVLAVKVLSQTGELPDWLSAARRAQLTTQLEQSGYPVSPPIYDSSDPLSAEQLTAYLGVYADALDNDAGE